MFGGYNHNCPLPGPLPNSDDKCKDKVNATGRIFFISDSGSIVGQENTKRLDALPWYKRLYAKINKSYRDRFVDIKGFKIDEL